MALFYQHREEELRWGIWKMDEDIDKLLSYFSKTDDYINAIQRFSNENRKKEWLSVRVLLLHLCGEEKRILYHPSDKPYLEDGSYHISISHTKGYVAVSLHPSGRTGIDIEKYGDKVCKVQSKFMQEKEIRDLPRQSTEEKVRYLLLCFSAKEAVYKLLGIEGLEIRSHLFVLPFEPSSDKGEFNVKELKTGTDQQFPVKYMIHPDFVLTYVVD